MPRQRRYVLIALAFQLLMVVTGSLYEPVYRMSGLFGMGIPLVVGWLYTVRRGLSLADASKGGLLIGAVGAAVGILVAILLSDQPWSLLPLGTVASAGTGWSGAFLGWMLKARKAPPA